LNAQPFVKKREKGRKQQLALVFIEAGLILIRRLYRQLLDSYRQIHGTYTPLTFWDIGSLISDQPHFISP
jgi:hypothetical protein